MVNDHGEGHWDMEGCPPVISDGVIVMDGGDFVRISVLKKGKEMRYEREWKCCRTCHWNSEHYVRGEAGRRHPCSLPSDVVNIWCDTEQGAVNFQAKLETLYSCLHHHRKNRCWRLTKTFGRIKFSQIGIYCVGQSHLPCEVDLTDMILFSFNNNHRNGILINLPKMYHSWKLGTISAYRVVYMKLQDFITVWTMARHWTPS